MSDLLISDCTLPHGQRADLLLREGRIVEIGSGLKSTGERLDAKGLLALPGAIDMHVHFRTPGASHKETLLSGAQAAVKGGVTTCADMPNTSPHTTTLAALEQKQQLAAGAAANLLFNFGATPDNFDEVRQAAQHPAVKALKIYMGPSTGVGGLGTTAVEAHMRQAAQLNLPVIVHAEDMEIIAAAQGNHTPHVSHHHQLRGLEAELSAIEQALRIAAVHGTRLYLAHVTSAKVVALAAASGLGAHILVEACPHHLLLSTKDIREPEPNRYKVNPPLRPPAERAALFAALPEGIGCLGSDHAPHTLSEKQQPYPEAPSGIPGVEYLLPLALNWWRQGTISLARLIELTSANAAAYFGLNKGELSVGRDGDVVLVDEDECWRIGEGDDTVASKCGWSPYVGMTLQGRPKITIVAGRRVYPA